MSILVSAAEAEGDPDPWTLISVALTFISIATWTFDKISNQETDEISLTDSQETNIQRIKDSVEEGIKATEKLLFIFQNTDTQILRSPFRLGAYRFGITGPDRERLQNTVGALTLAIHKATLSTIALTERDGDVCGRITQSIRDEQADIESEIARLYSTDVSNEEAVECCLRMLRSWDRALGKILGYQKRNG